MCNFLLRKLEVRINFVPFLGLLVHLEFALIEEPLPTIFKADHPFVFYLEKYNERLPQFLFVGRISNPKIKSNL